MSVSWERQSDEPELWYDRFTVYRLMGPTRTLPAAYALVCRLCGRRNVHAANRWEKPAQQWAWARRAADYDAEQARLRQVDETNRRQAMVDHLLELVVQAVLTADLPALSQTEARKLLPTLRLFYRDLFVAQGQELARGQEGEPLTLSAEELRVLLEQADQFRAGLEGELATGLPAWRRLRDVLAGLYPDEASARRVAAQAGLESARIAFGGQPINTWHALLTEAEHGGQVEAVAAVAQQEYPANPQLRQALREFRKETGVSRGKKKPQSTPSTSP
jgi:hypothetical protein